MALKMVRVSPSILAVDWQNEITLNAVIDQLEHSSASFIHLDVMDGKFVQNKTFDEKMVEYIRNRSTLMMDVHLMVENPEKVIDNYLKAGADILTVHYEACKDIEPVLKRIRSKNVLAGVAISPKTPAYKLKDLLKTGLVDVVLVMGVEPGASAQTFIPGMAEKVAEIREMDKNVIISIDGGVNLKNAKLVRTVGANILVSGSTVFKSKNIRKTIQALRGSWGSKFAKLFKKDED